MGPFQRCPQRFRLWDSRRRRQWGRRPAGRFAEVSGNVSRVAWPKFGLDHGGKKRLGGGEKGSGSGKKYFRYGNWRTVQLKAKGKQADKPPAA
ncbi:MAG: hypothetical protein C6W56_08290 [Caldibacillus debilis]|nr:MAG: hypothetical protein C6W56_08290 [Caldibacillus debilis]